MLLKKEIFHLFFIHIHFLFTLLDMLNPKTNSTMNKILRKNITPLLLFRWAEKTSKLFIQLIYIYIIVNIIHTVN